MSSEPKQDAVLDGTLARIVFQNPETEWAVAKFNTSAGTEVTVVGSLIGLGPGAPLRLRGEWVTDARYGRQFKAHSYLMRSPETKLGIERYLGSGLIPGIGPELAKRLVNRFGHDTLEVIGRSPEQLTDVSGIGPVRAKKIAHSFASQQAVQDVMVFLRSHGVSTAFAARIFKRYGSEAINIVRQNPYRLALDIWGIGFLSADRIATSLGIARDSPHRIEAGVLHCLDKMSEDGHVIVPEIEAVARASELLGVDTELVTDAMARLEGSALLVTERLANVAPAVALADLYDHETQAARALGKLLTTPNQAIQLDVDAAIARFEKEREITLANNQKLAVALAVEDKCTVITGGPGVGKTMIVRAVVATLAAKQRRIVLAAPTGRAAKRLAESTGGIAKTIHRLLEFQPKTRTFERNIERPLEADIVIVDEASMIDIALFRALVEAIPARAQLVLVGDIDQLPSVGPGRVLADIIDSGTATIIALNKIFRQAAASSIVTSAHAVNRGELPPLKPPAGDDPNRANFYFIERTSAQDAHELVVELVAKRIPERFGFDPLRDIQVLAPMHRGELGTRALNESLQAALSGGAETPALVRGNKRFAVGDKVIQLKNDYDRDVFNGDVGTVAKVDLANKSLTVELPDGRWIDYDIGDIDNLALAFAITIHKSQGSEYPVVILPIGTQHYMMLQRNLLYTAITRGKQLVVLVGTERAISMAVKNQSSRQRWTRLARRIRSHVESL